MDSLAGMDLAERIREVSRRINKSVGTVATEEATKTALVLPFISQVLGFNMFDPHEVVPEYIADVGTKKGEKADYAILVDDTPIMLFECKHYGVDLSKEHADQLYRYFSVTSARIAILTDGATYRFFSDIDAPNVMDLTPFLELNMLDADSIDPDDVRQFTKVEFNRSKVLNTARDLKYKSQVMALLEKEFAEPSDTLVTHFETQIYRGAETSPVRDAFMRATRKAMHQFLSRHVNDRSKLALSRDEAEQAPSEQAVGPAANSGTNQSESGTRSRKVVEYTLFGKQYSTRSVNEAYCAIFRAFIERDATFADRAIPLLSKRRNRRLAKRREELSASASMLRGAVELPGRYWLMCNLVNAEKLKALQTACKAAEVPFNDPEGLQIQMPNVDSP